MKWIDNKYLNSPNEQFKITSGWYVIPYVTTVIYKQKWAIILGIYDYNNGSPNQTQYAIGPSCIDRRTSIGNAAWSDWRTLHN